MIKDTYTFPQLGQELPDSWMLNETFNTKEKNMTTTRCKFKCGDVTDHGVAGDGKRKRSVVMTPVYSSDPNHENKAFWDASPGGEFKLYWVNDKVAFEPGKEYYIDITEAPASK